MANFPKLLFQNCHLGRLIVPRGFSRNASNDTIGFIGLGNMGFGMANNLLQKGREVVAYDVVPEALSILKTKGAKTASSPAEVASRSSAIITMLPNNAIVNAVYATGKDPIADAVKPGTLLIDSSTVDPGLSQELAELFKAKDVRLVDAPVSGGTNAANAGTLTIMVGAADNATFNIAKSILDNVGKNVIHCGEVGTGQAVKLCNNMLLAISMIGASETMNLGIKLGLDPKLLASILGASTGRCWSVDTYNPVPGVMPNVPSSNDYKGGFGAALMSKDLGLCQNAAARTAASTPLGALSNQLYKIICDSGHGGKDFSYAYQFLLGQKK